MNDVLGILLSIVLGLITYLIYRYVEERIFRRSNYEKWKEWKKHNTNNPIYKFFVLLGWSHSPSFEYYHRLIDYESNWRGSYKIVVIYCKDVRKKGRED